MPLQCFADVVKVKRYTFRFFRKYAMAGEVLSQSEVENLLNMMSSPAGAPPSPIGNAGLGIVERDKAINKPSGPAWMSKEKITSIDFKSPDRVGKDQMKTLQTMHEGFGRKFAANLAALLRAVVDVKLTSVDQLAYSEFMFGLDNPTCFNVLRAEPLEGNLILDINPSILFPMIDKMLGGGKEPTMTARRPLTDIEQRLVLRITKMFLGELKHAWENVIDLEFEVIQTESNPQIVQVVPPNEVVIVLCFEIAMVEVRGAITLCIPYNSFERISNKLTSTNWTGYSSKKQATPQTIKQISKDIRNMKALVKVKLVDTTMKVHEFVNLKVGDVLCTQKRATSPLLVSVEGIPKYWASPGKFKGYTAIEIEENIEDPTSLIAIE